MSLFRSTVLFKYLSRLTSVAVLGWVCMIFLVNTNLGLFDLKDILEDGNCSLYCRQCAGKRQEPQEAVPSDSDGAWGICPSLSSLSCFWVSPCPSTLLTVVTLRTVGNLTLRWKRSRRINRSHPHCLTLEIVCYPSSGFSNPASTLPTSWALLPLASNACTSQQRFWPEFVGTEGRGHLSNSDWLGIADR